MTDVDQQEWNLNRYWNELLTPGAAPDTSGVEDAAGETIRQIHRMTRAPVPSLAQSIVDAAVSSWLMAPMPNLPNSHTVWQASQSHVPSRGDAQDAARGHKAGSGMASESSGMPLVPRRTSWRSLPSVSAMLVLVLLSLICLAYATPHALRERGPIPPAISGDINNEMLFALTLPAAALPHGDRVSAGLDDYSLAPGEVADWEPAAGACCSGIRMIYLLEGSLTVSSSVDARLVRASLSLEPGTVAAGASVALAPGDGFVSPFDAAFISSNPGQEPARFLDISFIDGYFPLLSVPEKWIWHPDGDVTYGLFLPDQPAILRLDRVLLDPGAVLLPAPGAFTQLGVTIADNEPIETCGKDAIRNIGDAPVTVHVATLLPVGAASLPALPEEPDPACIGAVPLDAAR